MVTRRKALLLAVVAVLLTNALTYAALTLSSFSRLSIQDVEFSKLLMVLDHIERRFVDEVDRTELIEGAVAGMVRATGDPYSAYYKPREWRDLMIRASGNYFGIGIYIAAKDRYITVIAPIRGTPAEKAGIRAGDLIIRVDDRDIIDMSADQVADLIRGPEGTMVKLTIVREGVSQPIEIQVARAAISVPAAEWSMMDGGIGYIRITEFNNQATPQVKQAIAELKARGAEAFVVDLRQNPGGLIDSAVGVTDLFIDKGPVVHVMDRDGHRETHNSRSPGLGLPFVVLIDGGSASASEIFAGAVQDTASGVIVGQKSFGKGSVQVLITMNDGSGLKITIQKYYTPNGRSIHGTGITPDVVVEPEAPAHTFEPLESRESIRAGDVSITVLGLQHRLQFLGYQVPTGGVFDLSTEQALKHFQKDSGLLASGEADYDTLELINREVEEKQKPHDVQLEKAVEVLKSMMAN